SSSYKNPKGHRKVAPITGNFVFASLHIQRTDSQVLLNGQKDKVKSVKTDVSNEYIVGVKVNSVDLIAKTQYNSFGEVIYTITWNSCNEKIKHLERCRNQNQLIFKTQLPKKLFHELQSELQKNKRLKALAYSAICACDKLLIFCNIYYQLVAIMPEMVRKYKVEKRRQEITRIIDHIIPIHIVQVNSIASNGAYRSLKDILFVLIPKLAYSKSVVLQVEDVIHVKLSRD
ncbi:4910_t:CDS:2, partial [Gigaspora margarita]